MMECYIFNSLIESLIKYLQLKSISTIYSLKENNTDSVQVCTRRDLYFLK